MELMPLDRRQRRAFRALYRAAFPACERQPFWFLLRQQRRGLAQLYTAQGPAGLLGLCVLVPGGDVVMVNYLAVAHQARGGGIGTELLAAIRALHPARRVVLEIETPKKDAGPEDLRLRRRGFYLRSGYRETGVRIHIGGNDMTLLSLGGHVTYGEYCDLQRSALGPFLWHLLRVRQLAP